MDLPGLTELIYDRFTQYLCHWCSTGGGEIFLVEGTSVDNFSNGERAENIPDIASIESTTLLNRRPRLMHIKAQ